MKPHKQRTGPRIAPAINATNLQIAEIRRKLYEIRQYKIVLEQDGLSPDEDDKRRESALIIRLLRLEKSLKGEAPPRPKPQSDMAMKPERTPRRGRGRTG